MNPTSGPEVYDFDGLWDYANPSGTEQKFFTCLESEPKSDSNYRAELLTQIARAQGLQQRFDNAHETLDAAEILIGDSASRARIRLLLERGRAFNSSGSPELARPLFLNAFELGKSLGQDFYAVDAAHMLAIVLQGNERFRWNEEALAMAEVSTDARARNWRGSLYNNIGWDLFAAGEYGRALGLFERALEFRISQAQPENIRFAKWSIAKTLRHLGEHDRALVMQVELQREVEETGAEADGFVFEELGELYLAKGDLTAAQPNFCKAFELLSKDIWLARDEPARLKRIGELCHSKSE